MKKMIRVFLSLIVLTFIPLAHADFLGGGGISGGGTGACATNFKRVAPYLCLYSGTLSGSGTSLSTGSNVISAPSSNATGVILFEQADLFANAAAGLRYVNIQQYDNGSCVGPGSLPGLQFQTYEYTGLPFGTTIGRGKGNFIMDLKTKGSSFCLVFSEDTATLHSASYFIIGYYD